MLAPLVLIAAFAPHVPNITLCNYTIHVHKGCSPSRDWSLVARNVPSDASWRPQTSQTPALTPGVPFQGHHDGGGRHPLCLRRDVRSGRELTLISTEGDATLADLNGCDEPGGCFCCNVGEVGISSTVKDPSSCHPHEPVYSCKPGIGCQYCPHPLACPGSTTKDKCDDSCNPTVRCIDNACVPCPDPYDHARAPSPPRTATRPASARRCTRCDSDKHQCVADATGTFSKKSDCELECS